MVQYRYVSTYIHRIASLVRSPYASLGLTLHYDIASELTWESVPSQNIGKRQQESQNTLEEQCNEEEITRPNDNWDIHPDQQFSVW